MKPQDKTQKPKKWFTLRIILLTLVMLLVEAFAGNAAVEALTEDEPIDE